MDTNQLLCLSRIFLVQKYRRLNKLNIKLAAEKLKYTREI